VMRRSSKNEADPAM